MTKATPAPQKPRRRNKTNPHKANQFQVDPRQALFLQYYFDPKSATFSKGKQSAIQAGYEEKYAETLWSQMPKWLDGSIKAFRREALLEKAERNLDEALDLPTHTQAMGAFGPIYRKVGKKKVPVMVHNIGLISQRTSTAQFVAKGLGGKVYSDKAAGGLQLNVTIYGPEQLRRVAARIYNDEPAGEAVPDRLLDSDKS